MNCESFIRENYLTMTQVQIAEAIGRPQCTVSRIIKRLKLRYPKKLKSQRYRRTTDPRKSDNYIALQLAKRGSPTKADPTILAAVLRTPELIQLKRETLILKQTLHEQISAGA